MLGPALLLVAVGYAAWRLFGGYPRPQPGRFQVLTPGEVAFLAAAADALFPPGGAIPPSGNEAGIPEYVDRYLADVPPRMRGLMRLLFRLVEQATIFFPAPGGRGLRRFSSLRPEQRVAVLEGWQHSRFFPRRLVFTSLRAILTMGYFADPVVLRELHLAPYAIPVPVLEADLLYPPIGARPDAIRHRAEDVGAPSDGTPLDLDGALHPDYAGDPS